MQQRVYRARSIPTRSGDGAKRPSLLVKKNKNKNKNKKRHEVIGRNSSRVHIKHSFDDSWNIVEEIQWGLKALIKWVEPKPNKYSIIFIIINKSLLAAIIMRKTWDASAKTLHLYDRKVTRLSIPRRQITQSTQSKTSGEKGRK